LPKFGETAMAGPNFSQSDIYVVEDDIEVRRALLLILSRAGYRVTCFADGLSLIDALRSKPPACILLDIYLPGVSGIEILEGLRGKGYHTPVIVVSGNKCIGTAVEVLKLGAVDYIEKPFGGEDLLARVEHAIRGLTTPKSAPAIPSVFPGSGLLSQREREVLQLSALGASAKEIGKVLGLSPRTIEDHRATLLRKMGARNLAEVILRALAGGRSLPTGSSPDPDKGPI
jgi:FixJ family two-component response regulator